MAGRIRSIKPEILEDERSAGLSSDAWRLWVSMWLLADDHGRLRGSLVWLQGQIFWSRDPRETLASLVDELVKSGLIVCYIVDEQRYIEIRNWQKHQKVDHPSKPRIPAPPLVIAEESRYRREPSRDSRETLAPDLRPPTSDLDLEYIHAHARVGATELAKLWQPTGVLTPRGDELRAVVVLVEEYAKVAKIAADEALYVRAIAAFVALLKSWSFNKAATPAMFIAKWDDVQAVLGGLDPSERRERPAKQEAAIRPIPKVVGDKYQYQDDGE